MPTNGNEKVLLVTGTTSGIGRVTALTPAPGGYVVVASGRDEERMKDMEQETTRRGVELDIGFLEITDHESVKALITDVAHGYGHIDAVVSNASVVFTLGTAEQITSVQPAQEIGPLFLELLTSGNRRCVTRRPSGLSTSSPQARPTAAR